MRSDELLFFIGRGYISAARYTFDAHLLSKNTNRGKAISISKKTIHGKTISISKKTIRGKAISVSKKSMSWQGYKHSENYQNNLSDCFTKSAIYDKMIGE